LKCVYIFLADPVYQLEFLSLCIPNLVVSGQFYVGSQDDVRLDISARLTFPSNWFSSVSDIKKIAGRGLLQHSPS